MLDDRRERKIIGGDEHVMVILSNQSTDCVHKSGGGNVGVGYAPEVTDGPRSTLTFDCRERSDIDGDTMAGKRSCDWGRDSRNHSQNEDRLFHEQLGVTIGVAGNTPEVVCWLVLQTLQNVSSKFLDASL